MQGFEIAELKVHEIGRSLMVVLPKPWCYGHGIKKGDTVKAKLTGTGKLILEFESAKGGGTNK